MQRDLFTSEEPSVRAPEPEPARTRAPATWDLRLGRWQDVIAGVAACDSVIADPPYSERTQRGQRSNRTAGWMGDPEESRITYGYMTESDVHELVYHWAPRTRRWFVMFGDHLTVRWALDALDAVGFYTFHPIPWVKPDAGPRVCGDGPSPQSEQIAIARPVRRMFAPELRYRPGWYGTRSRTGQAFVGSKPLDLMRAVVRDYSEPGDLIVDPYAGNGTTLLASIMEGRSAIGAEQLAEHYEGARKRLERGYTPSLFASVEEDP